MPKYVILKLLGAEIRNRSLNLTKAFPVEKITEERICGSSLIYLKF